MQGMETACQAPVTSVVVSFSVGALLPRQCFTYPEPFQAHLLAPLLSVLTLGPTGFWARLCASWASYLGVGHSIVGARDGFSL